MMGFRSWCHLAPIVSAKVAHGTHTIVMPRPSQGDPTGAPPLEKGEPFDGSRTPRGMDGIARVIEEREPDQKPLLLVDIDGVLNPFVRAGDLMPEGYTEHVIAGQQVLLRRIHGEWLHDLADRFELAWVSTWEAASNTLIGPAIGAPPELPYIEFRERTDDGWTWKLPAVRRYAEDRALAWLDDDPGPDAAGWAATRAARTLIVSPDPRTGWTEDEYRQLVAFGAEGG